MKRALRVVTMLSLFALIAVSAHAQTSSSNQMKASIPFKFAIGHEALPAGDYVISFASRSSDATTMIIRSADGHTSRIVMTLPALASAIRESGKLVFNRYGQQYFLSQVWWPADETGLQLPKSHSERALERELVENRRPERVTVALARR